MGGRGKGGGGGGEGSAADGSSHQSALGRSDPASWTPGPVWLACSTRGASHPRSVCRAPPILSQLPFAGTAPPHPLLTSVTRRGEAAGAVLAVAAHEGQHSVAAGQALLGVSHLLRQAWVREGREYGNNRLVGKSGCVQPHLHVLLAAEANAHLDATHACGAHWSQHWLPGYAEIITFPHRTHPCTRGTWGSCRTSSWGRACSRG